MTIKIMVRSRNNAAAGHHFAFFRDMPGAGGEEEENGFSLRSRFDMPKPEGFGTRLLCQKSRISVNGVAQE